jgi:hypothetical protein
MKMICRILFGAVPANESGSARRHDNGGAPAGGGHNIRISCLLLEATEPGFVALATVYQTNRLYGIE